MTDQPHPYDDNETTISALPGRLKARREALRISQAKAAERTGVTLRTWQRWESGATQAHVGYVPALANALETTPEELLGVQNDGEAAEPRGLDDLAMERRLQQIEATQREVLGALGELRQFLSDPRAVLAAAELLRQQERGEPESRPEGG